MAKRHLTLEDLKQGGFLALCRTLLLFVGIGAAAEIPGSSRYDGNEALIAGHETAVRSGDLPARYSTPAQIVAETALTEPSRVTLRALAVEDGKKLQPADRTPRLWLGLGDAIEVGLLLPTTAASPVIGFHSRAPPAA